MKKKKAFSLKRHLFQHCGRVNTYRKWAKNGFESTASNTELSELSWPSPSLCGENSVSSSQPTIYVTKRTHRVFFAKLTEFAPELSEAQ